jgi:hypothetical protein
MQDSVYCPLCKIPVTIHKGKRKGLKSTHHQTRKSQVYCSQCGNNLKEALVLSMKKDHQNMQTNSQIVKFISKG